MGERGAALSTLHAVVRGRVQGVGFRWFVRERGRALRLTGWVRNRSDGSVEVFAVGDEAALQRLRGLLRAGPAGSHVSDLDDLDAEPMEPALDPFGILK